MNKRYLNIISRKAKSSNRKYNKAHKNILAASQSSQKSNKKGIRYYKYTMVHFKNTALAAFAALASFLPGAQSSPYLLSDDRVRSLDAVPALGRGYSIMTNSFQSTCLDIDVTAVPSYNYDCKCPTCFV